MDKLNRGAIGIFDSGLGGLTVFREIEKVLPHEDLIYFGDTARVPYGSKSRNSVIRFSTESILFLLKKKVKLVVVACNTSSSLALDYLKKIFSIPLIGVIAAGSKKAISVSKKKRIGIIGTKSTIKSGAYQKEIFKQDKGAYIYVKACPLFVPLVEEGLLNGRITNSIIKMYLQEVKDKIDTLILGCTHYPLLKKAIGDYLKGVYLIDSAKEVALETKNALQQNGLLNEYSKKASKDFYVTDEPFSFRKKAVVFLKHSITTPKVAAI